MSDPNETDYDELDYLDDNNPDGRYRARLVRWAARALWLMPEQIAKVTAEVVGGCGNGTCEFTEVEINVMTGAGQHYRGESSFGDYLSEIIDSELDDAGVRVGYLRDEPLFKLELVESRP